MVLVDFRNKRRRAKERAHRTMQVSVWAHNEWSTKCEQVHVRALCRLRRRFQCFIMERDCVVLYIIYIDALEMLYRFSILQSIGGSNKVR